MRGAPPARRPSVSTRGGEVSRVYDWGRREATATAAEVAAHASPARRAGRPRRDETGPPRHHQDARYGGGATEPARGDGSIATRRGPYVQLQTIATATAALRRRLTDRPLCEVHDACRSVSLKERYFVLVPPCVWLAGARAACCSISFSTRDAVTTVFPSIDRTEYQLWACTHVHIQDAASVKLFKQPIAMPPPHVAGSCSISLARADTPH